MTKHMEYKGIIKGFGSQVQGDTAQNFVVIVGKGEIFLPKDIEVTLSWDE